jgi:hypothetical protein
MPASPRSGSPAKAVASPGPTATTFKSSRLAPPSPTKRASVSASATPPPTLQTPALRRTAAPRRDSLGASTGPSAHRDSLSASVGPGAHALPLRQRAPSPPQPLQALQALQPRTASGASQASSLLSPLGSELHHSHSPIGNPDSDADADASPPGTAHVRAPPAQIVRAPFVLSLFRPLTSIRRRRST